MWALVVLLTFFGSIRSDKPNHWVISRVPSSIPSIMTAVKLINERPNCRVNLYTVDIGSYSQYPIVRREDEPITNFVPQYYWDFPCQNEYDYYNFNMMRFSNKFYLTGCFFFNNPNQRLKCFSLMEYGVFEEILDVYCEDTRIWFNGERFYIKIGDETDPNTITVGSGFDKCVIQKNSEGKYSKKYEPDNEIRVLSYDALYNRTFFSLVNYWKIFAFGWSFNWRPDKHYYLLFHHLIQKSDFSSQETKENMSGYVYMKETFDFIFDINLVANYTNTVILPVPEEGPVCLSGSEGYCKNITGKHGNDVNDTTVLCQRSAFGNYWNTSMCYQMKKDNCIVYGCELLDLPSVVPSNWAYCKGDSLKPLINAQFGPGPYPPPYPPSGFGPGPYPPPYPPSGPFFPRPTLGQLISNIATNGGVGWGNNNGGGRGGNGNGNRGGSGGGNHGRDRGGHGGGNHGGNGGGNRGGNHGGNHGRSGGSHRGGNHGGNGRSHGGGGHGGNRGGHGGRHH